MKEEHVFKVILVKDPDCRSLEVRIGEEGFGWEICPLERPPSPRITRGDKIIAYKNKTIPEPFNAAVQELYKEIRNEMMNAIILIEGETGIRFKKKEES
ncbi:MAG: hypothetical protein E3J76_01600 [Candidatus Aminicenantes bacterium]|nr:MAG: hypothetical protein E3J76_01600 [Candidatus Aminicenantes bacterium]